jgi:hypothetical protein
MKKLYLLSIMVAVLVSVSSAQDVYYSIFSFTHSIPEVRINDAAVSLQSSLYPDLYRSRSAARDIRWVARNDSQIVAFWEQNGDTILHILTELSGIEWREQAFDIYLVRYFPSLGSAEPLIIPVGGMKGASLIEAAPSGNRFILDLIYQLAHRMLAQAARPGDSVRLSIADHPLMRPGPYRRDNLAMLLALATCTNIIGMDSTMDAYNSAFWVRHLTGRRIFEEYLLNKWVLTPERTLADWISAEPYWSKLVVATRPPRLRQRPEKVKNQVYIEGLPLKGQLGFSVKIDEANYLTVDTIDVYRLAYACGLRAGDRIHSVEGYRVRTHRELVERILEYLDTGGATLQVLRNDRLETVLIRPIALPGREDSLYYEDEYFPEEDTTSVSPETTYEDEPDR